MLYRSENVIYLLCFQQHMSNQAGYLLKVCNLFLGAQSNCICPDLIEMFTDV